MEKPLIEAAYTLQKGTERPTLNSAYFSYKKFSFSFKWRKIIRGMLTENYLNFSKTSYGPLLKTKFKTSVLFPGNIFWY